MEKRSLFDRLFGRRPKEDGKYEGFFTTLTAYAPQFSNFAGGIYESEICRAAIDAIARNISKLSITLTGAAKPYLQAKLRKAPNEWQSWSAFLYRLANIYYSTNTAVIVPVFGEYGEPTGYYPVLPQNCEIVQYNFEPFLRFTFTNGEKAAVELSSCAILSRFQLKDDFFGSDNKALTPTLDLLAIQNQGIREGVKNGASFRFAATARNILKDEDLKKERERFNRENLQNGGGGLLLFPSTFENARQLENKPYIVDSETTRIIRENVYNYFGVNAEVVQNAAYGDKWNAFYEGCIEPFAIQFSEAMTKAIFTERERAQGAALFATSNRLQYMSNSDKLAVSAQLADRGILNRDEIREIWNLPPLPNGEGQAYIIRGEYYEATAKLEEGENENGN